MWCDARFTGVSRSALEHRASNLPTAMSSSTYRRKRPEVQIKRTLEQILFPVALWKEKYLKPVQLRQLRLPRLKKPLKHPRSRKGVYLGSDASLKKFYYHKRHIVFRFPGGAKIFNLFKRGLHDIAGTGR